MVDRVWLNSYPAGIPADIDVSHYNSVLDLFDEAIQKFADKPAFSNFGKSLSFAKLNLLSHRFASYLQKLGNLSKGDRVAVSYTHLDVYKRQPQARTMRAEEPPSPGHRIALHTAKKYPSPAPDVPRRTLKGLR